MNILAIGDIIGGEGCRFLREKLPALKRLKGIHLTIANGENSADGNGITPSSAKFLFDSGVDVITTGNHAFRRRESYDLFDSEPFLLRPANFPKGAPGHGWCVVDKGRVQVCISNIMGTVYMESMACPFETVSSIIEKTPEAGIQIVDFHAEATGEKRALAFFLDGRASALFGTHTPVPPPELASPAVLESPAVPEEDSAPCCWQPANTDAVRQAAIAVANNRFINFFIES